MGVFAHAAEEGEGGEGEDVLAGAAGIPRSTAPARQDPVGAGVAGCTAGRGEAQEGAGRGKVRAGVLGLLRAAWDCVEWEVEGWLE